MRLRYFLPTAVIVLALCPMVRADDPPLPPADELKKMVDGGHYAEVLKFLVRILDVKGASVANYDRYDMFMLRAECLIQTKQNFAALDSLESARKEAVSAKNDQRAQQAMALSQLLKQAPGGTYMPRTGKTKKPISIIDPNTRKSAFEAYFADEMALADFKIKASKGVKTLPPIIDAVKAVAPIRPLELAATGENKQTDQIMGELSKAAQDLITTGLEGMTARVNSIHEDADMLLGNNNRPVDPNAPNIGLIDTHRRGLTQQTAAALRSIMVDCDRIAHTAADLAQAVVTDAEAFKNLADKAGGVKLKANEVLTSEY